MRGMTQAADVSTQLPVNRGHAEDLRADLERLGADPESAHLYADRFAERALQAIADGHPDPQGLATNAIVVLGADIERWYA